MNKIIYNKLLLQAKEAEAQGMTKLANSIVEAINSDNEDNSYEQLQDSFHKDMWKMAARLMHYYDFKSVDAEKLDRTILSWASKILDDLEITLNVDEVVKGPNEPLVPGEKE